MKLTAKIFLESGGKYVLGPGRLELLRTVHERGSLRKAAQELGMSYRWAWGRLNNAEKELNCPLLVRTEEPVGGRPMVLTPQAIELVEWFSRVEKDLGEALGKAGKSLPDFIPRGAGDEGASAEQNKTRRLPLD